MHFQKTDEVTIKREKKIKSHKTTVSGDFIPNNM